MYMTIWMKNDDRFITYSHIRFQFVHKSVNIFFIFQKKVRKIAEIVERTRIQVFHDIRCLFAPEKFGNANTKKNWQ